MSPIEAIRDILEGLGYQDVYTGDFKAIQCGAGVWVRSAPPLLTEWFLGCDEDHETSTVQIVARGEKLDEFGPYETARTIRTQMKRQSDAFYNPIYPTDGDVLPLGRDDEGRYSFSVNIVLHSIE